MLKTVAVTLCSTARVYSFKHLAIRSALPLMLETFEFDALDMTSEHKTIQ